MPLLTAGDPHVHLYGCVDPALALDLAAGHGVDWGWLAGRWQEAGLPAPDFPALAARHLGGDATAAAELAAAMRAGQPGFAAFQARYDLVVACSRWASGRHDRWTTELSAELERVWDGRGPGEYRVLLPATASHAWAEAAVAELGRTCTHAPGRTLAISLPRSDTMRHWPVVAAARTAGVPITGIDLCGVEDEPSDHRALAEVVAGSGLDLLVHVGEQLRTVQPATAIRRVHDALRLGARRLGHALAVRLDPHAWPATSVWERVDERRRQLAWELAQADRLGLDAGSLRRESAELAGRDPASQVPARPMDAGRLRALQDLVLADLAAAGTVVEVCPTSNRLVSGAAIAAHGIERLDAAGVPWVVGTDDPGILGTDLATERWEGRAPARPGGNGGAGRPTQVYQCRW